MVSSVWSHQCRRSSVPGATCRIIFCGANGVLFRRKSCNSCWLQWCSCHSHFGGVNDIGGHITYSLCALKSHILQIRLTGHTTCKTCASKITNRYAVWFLLKKKVTRYAPEVIWTKLFLVQNLKNIAEKRFSRSPQKNIDTVQNNSVAFEY
jgi:hypothetical protein